MTYTTRRASADKLVYHGDNNERTAVLTDTHRYRAPDDPKLPHSRFEVRKYIDGKHVETVTTDDHNAAAEIASMHVDRS